jgi:fatty acid-binding protein DegV
MEELAALHSHAPEEAQDLVELWGDFFPFEHITIAEVGSIVGTAAGPGAVGVAFLLAENQTQSSQ